MNYDFLWVLDCNLASAMHRFVNIEDFQLTGNDDVEQNLHQGALQVTGTSLFWKTEYDFLWVFYCNFASIMHRFVYIEVLLLTENDVKAKSPPRGSASDWYKITLKEKM